jgi:hypothetical protein
VDIERVVKRELLTMMGYGMSKLEAQQYLYISYEETVFDALEEGDEEQAAIWQHAMEIVKNI